MNTQSAGSAGKWRDQVVTKDFDLILTGEFKKVRCGFLANHEAFSE